MKRKLWWKLKERVVLKILKSVDEIFKRKLGWKKSWNENLWKKGMKILEKKFGMKNYEVGMIFFKLGWVEKLRKESRNEKLKKRRL